MRSNPTVLDLLYLQSERFPEERGKLPGSSTAPTNSVDGAVRGDIAHTRKQRPCKRHRQLLLFFAPAGKLPSLSCDCIKPLRSRFTLFDNEPSRTPTSDHPENPRRNSPSEPQLV